VSSRFLERIAYDRLTHLPRYLKALLIRAERAALNPAKDQNRLRQLAPYQAALKKLQAQPGRSPEAQRQIAAFRWMIEEFKVSLFAQELGTAMPVSPKRLDQQLKSSETQRSCPVRPDFQSAAGALPLPKSDDQRFPAAVGSMTSVIDSSPTLALASFQPCSGYSVPVECCFILSRHI
jgi:ATP-dependent helicase HrpA